MGMKETTGTENHAGKEISSRETALKETRNPSETGTLKNEITSQEVSDRSFHETVEHVTTEFKDVIPAEQTGRIEREVSQKGPEVMSPEDYEKRFRESDPAVLGHYDSEGRIYLKEGNPETIKHVTTHEALHLTSYKESSENSYRSGIREVTYNEDGTKEEANRALNEGITELYALREMQQQGEYASMMSVTAYPEAQRKAFELQNLVGEDTIQEAYFGGKLEALENEVNRLHYNDETAWRRYSKNLDVVEYGTDPAEIREAKRRLTIQNVIMHSCKEFNGEA